MADFDIDERERLIDACIAQLDENTKATIPGALLRAVCARVRTLEAALLALVNAADDVGVRHFDTDTMSPEVETMQTATLNARTALQEGKGHG